MSGFGEAAHPPVIFLDIDGVLNRTSGATHIRLDQDLVSRLRTIVARSGCRIVLSTFWRGFDTYVRYILHRRFFAGVITDCKPRMGVSETTIDGSDEHFWCSCLSSRGQ